MIRLALLLLLSNLAIAQSVQPSSSAPPTPTPNASAEIQLSPQAAYDKAARPVDIVRRPVSNWSDVEQAALAVAKAQAAVECAARSPYQYHGDDLLAFARLCAFGDAWLPVQQAALGYLIAQSAATPAEKLTNFPGLSMAFDYDVQASLHLGNTANAFGTAQTMLRTVAYDDLASEAVNSVVRYVQLIQSDQALVLLRQRQPILLAMLKARGDNGKPTTPLAADGTPMVTSTRPPMALHDLYADAIALPAFLQFMNKPDQASAAFTELEASLPANLSADDTILNAASRRQYMLLGSPLPTIAASASLLDRAHPAPPDLSRKGAGASTLLLFPDWCAQCVAMGVNFMPANAKLSADGFHFYALLAQANPSPSSAASPAPAKSKPAVAPSARSGVKPNPTPLTKPQVPHVEITLGTKSTAADQLVGTQTLIVPNELLDTFAATDFPLLIASDSRGLVRYIAIAPDNVLVDGGLIYQVAERVNELWPPAKARPASQH